MTFAGDRDQLIEWADAREPDGLVAYRGGEERRRRSTGFPGSRCRRRGRTVSTPSRIRLAACGRPPCPRPGRDGRARGRRAPALGRRRPARGSPATRRCPSSGSRCSCCPVTATRRSSCPGSRRRGSSSGPSVFTMRPWDETDDPVALVAALAGPRRRRRPSATTPGPGSCSTCSARLPRPAFWRGAAAVTGPLRAVKDAAEIEALRRAGAAVDRVAAEMQRRRRRARRAHRGRRLRRARRAACSRRATSRVNFAIVAAGAERGQPPPRAGRPRSSSRARSCCATSAARCSTGRWATAPTSPAACRSASPPPRCATSTPCSRTPRPQPWPPATVGTPCEDGRRARPGASSPRPGFGERVHPSHRSRHRRRGARGPLHRGGQRDAARARPRVHDRARHLPRRVASGSASRTSSSPPSDGPERLNRVDRGCDRRLTSLLRVGAASRAMPLR